MPSPAKRRTAGKTAKSTKPTKSKAAATRSKSKKPGKLWLHADTTPLSIDRPGPFVAMPNGHLATPDRYGIAITIDAGQTWTTRPLYGYGENDKEFKISNERVLLRTRKGSLILSFMNLNERHWLWRPELHDALPDTRLPHYVARSTDNGKTWQPAVHLHEDWTGEIRNIIQTKSGRLVLSSMKLLHNPGRHTVLTYGSDDDGQSWTPSNIIDLGGCGHHGGVTEAPIEQLNDGRILMLLRTNWGAFWKAVSHDEGRSWRDIQPTTIDASSAPGLLKRLASGRLILCWNRLYPEGKKSFPLTGGDNEWSEVPVSNHREELSIAFSDDEAETWSRPIVIARQKNAWLSYPRLHEHTPGELWLTTMQGGLRLILHEKDFI